MLKFVDESLSFSIVRVIISIWLILINPFPNMDMVSCAHTGYASFELKSNEPIIDDLSEGEVIRETNIGSILSTYL